MTRAMAVSLLLLVVSALRVDAQATSCQIGERQGGSLQFFNQGQPNEIINITLPLLHCGGGRTIIADQGVLTRAANRVDLYRNVQITEPGRVLSADQVNYFFRQQHLAATGNARMRDTNTGSVIVGDNINFYEATPTRPEQRIEAVATTGIARAVLRQLPGAGAAAGATADSTTIDAAQITIIGERSFLALGNAVMVRDSMRTTGYSISYTESAGTLVVAGGGRVTLPSYVMTGDSIDARIGSDEQIESVLARHGAKLESADMSVVAAAVRLMFENGAVTRMVAMDWRPASNAMPAARARVESVDFRMESDSIDVLAPGGEIREAVAIGSAWGERVTPDSLRGYLPEVSDSVRRYIENDWMRGDTVRAFFAAAPARAPGDATSGRLMERLMAAGAPAQSIYRFRNEQQPDAKLSVNYLTAGRMEVEFTDGLVAVVNASDDARGVYVQPAAATQRADNTAAPPPEQR